MNRLYIMKFFRYNNSIRHTTRTKKAMKRLNKIVDSVSGDYSNQLYEAEQELISAFEEEEYFNRNLINRIRLRIKERV